MLWNSLRSSLNELHLSATLTAYGKEFQRIIAISIWSPLPAINHSTVTSRQVHMWLCTVKGTPFHPVRCHFETWAQKRVQRSGLPQNEQKQCTHRDPVPTFVPEYSTQAPTPCLNTRIGTWKKGLFTLVPSKNRTRVPCPGTQCKRYL